jgi:predicted ribosome quality control (RQC) complex YloA/Tae2 family protein
MKALAQLEMAKRKRKPTLHFLNEKYFGPFRTQEARSRSRERLKKAIQYLRKREEHQKRRLEHLLAI